MGVPFVGVELGVLGPLQVIDGERAIRIGGAHERALLAVLAFGRGDTVSADRIVDALWGDHPPRSASKQVQNHVLRLRKVLGADAIRTAPGGYALGQKLTVDIGRFEAALRDARAAAGRGAACESLRMFDDALAAWRGRPFEELGGWEAGAAEAARLEEVRRTAEEEEIEARLDCGTASDCVPDIEVLVAAEPLREHRWAQLMQGLYRAGRQADALRAFQRARETLARELGIAPGPALQAMERRVLTQDPDLLAPSGPGPRDLPRGVVTFLLTDVEGSTRLWEDLPDAMADAIALHDGGIAAEITAAGGTLLKSKGEGDSTLSVFARATDAAVAALAIRDRLGGTDWPAGASLSVRCALHTGEAVERAGDYFGPTLNRAARIRALAVGGQILVSQATAELVRDHLPPGSDLVELGPFELRDLERPERVFALVEPGRPGRDIAVGVCPYQGLLAFEPEDHERFFGRDEVVANVLARLTATRRVAVVGASGSGKSSLVRAGIAASLAPGDVVLMRPGPHPLDELNARLSARARGDRTEVHRELVTDLGAVFQRVGQSATGHLTIVVDQLEELFTLCSDDAERIAFLDVLVGAGTGPRTQSAVVVALRADFYGRCAEHPAFAEMVSSATVLLGPMRPTELRAAIEGPARRAGLRLEPGFTDLLMEDVAREPGALPLLSHALRETWRRRDGNTLSIAGYRAAGGIRGAIAHTADTIYDSLPPGRQDIVRSILLRLTELGEGTEDTRRKVPLAELAGDDREGARREVLELLADSRLVTIGEDGTEVAHEALIREWPRLRAWLDEDRDELRLLRDLGRAADAWVALDRDPGALYRGARLASVIEWTRADAPTRLTPLERAFLDASRDQHQAELGAAEARLHEQTQANRRLRRLLAGIAIALVVALAAGVLALAQRNRADDEASRAEVASRRATVGRLVAESGVLQDRDPQLSALLAVTANRLDDTAATRGALLKALLAEPRLRATLTGRSRPYYLVAYTPDGATLVVRAARSVDVFDARRGRLAGSVRLSGRGAGFGTGLAVSPDGTMFATGASDHRVYLFDVRSRRQIGAPLRAATTVRGIAFSPDGTMLATAAGAFGDATPVRTDETVQLWDVATRRQVRMSLSGHTASVNRLEFSPDGQLLATGGNDNLVVLHDARTGATVGAPMRIDSPVYSLAFSPDGSRLAVGGQGQHVFVFDAGTGRQVGSPLTAGIGSSVAFSPDGALLVTGSTFDSNTIVWDAATLTMIDTPMASLGAGVAFRPDGREFAVADYKGRVTLWSPESAPLIIQRIPGASRNAGRYSPDGAVLAVPDTSTVTLYDARTLRPLGPPLAVPGGAPLEGFGSIPARTAFSHDGTRLAVAGLGATVELFDVATLRHVGESMALESPALSLAFSPDGKTLAVGETQGDAAVDLIDLPSGRRRGPLAISGIVVNLAFSPDGRRLVATNGIGQAVVYDRLGRAAPRATPLPGDRGNVSAARFSPDGSVLATGGLDGTLRLRDGDTLRPLGPSTQTNDSLVIAIDFAPDGRMLAVGDLRGTFRLVDVASRQPIGDTFVGAGAGAPSFRRPDGRVLALSAFGGAALLSLDTAEWHAAACRLAGRNLTAAEHREYVGIGGRRVIACPGVPTQR